MMASVIQYKTGFLMVASFIVIPISRLNSSGLFNKCPGSTRGHIAGLFFVVAVIAEHFDNAFSLGSALVIGAACRLRDRLIQHQARDG